MATMQPSKATLGGIRRGGLGRPFGREPTAFEKQFSELDKSSSVQTWRHFPASPSNGRSLPDAPLRSRFCELEETVDCPS